MSLLTSKIRKVVGKGKSGYGRSMTWLYVGDEVSTYEENELVIAKLKGNFECMELVTKFSTNFIFFVYNSRTKEYIGSCKISEWSNKKMKKFIIIGYTNDTKENILRHLSQFDNLISLKKI